MKTVNSLLIASLIFSNSAFAQDKKIDRLFEESQAEVQAEIRTEKQNTQQLIDDLVDLEKQIVIVEEAIGNAKTIRTATLVISGGLLIATGLFIRSAQTSPDMFGLAGPILGIIGAGGGTVVSGAIAAGKHYEIRVETKKLEELKDRLKDVKKELNKRLADLK